MSKKIQGIHISTVKVDDIRCSYDLEAVEELRRIQIVATFTKDGKRIHRVHGLNGGMRPLSQGELIGELLNADYAEKMARDLIEDANRSAHSPFRKNLTA